MKFIIGALVISIVAFLSPYFWCSFTKFNYYVSVSGIVPTIINLVVNCIIHSLIIYAIYTFLPGWFIIAIIYYGISFFLCL